MRIVLRERFAPGPRQARQRTPMNEDYVPGEPYNLAQVDSSASCTLGLQNDAHFPDSKIESLASREDSRLITLLARIYLEEALANSPHECLRVPGGTANLAITYPGIKSVGNVL